MNINHTDSKFTFGLDPWHELQDFQKVFSNCPDHRIGRKNLERKYKCEHICG